MLRGSGLSRASAAGLTHPGLQAGSQVLSLPLFAIGVTNAAMTADTRYAHPVYVPQACTCTGLQMVVGTAVAQRWASCRCIPAARGATSARCSALADPN